MPCCSTTRHLCFEVYSIFGGVIVEREIKFKEMYIGLPDGGEEAKNEMFERLFCNYNSKYQEILNSPEKFLIIGSKGSGKTYLANYITKKQGKRMHCIINNVADFDKKIAELENCSLNNLCKWYLYKKIAEYLVSIHGFISTKCMFSQLYKLNEFLKQTNSTGSLFKPTHKKVKKNLEEENGGSMSGSRKGGIASIEGGTHNKSSRGYEEEVEYNRKTLQELCGELEGYVLKAAFKNEKLYIIFDDLDELDKTLQEGNENITINLIKTAKYINTEFSKRNISIKIILLVRSDILDNLQYYDSNLAKIKTSCGVELYWLLNTESAPEKNPLMNMVLHKIKTSCQELSQYSDKELYNKLFPEMVDRKKPLNYLLDHSFGRPRDIVMYLNHVMNEYPEESYFSAARLKQVKKLYASDLYDEMINQANFHRSVVYTKQCLDLLAGIDGVTFSYTDITNYYTNNRALFSEIDNLDTALSFLYRLGAIGNTWNQGKRSSWAYRKDARDDIDKTKNFTIHYGIRKKFSK